MGSLARTSAHDGRWDAQGFLRVPALVQWLATLRCPLSCPHCLSAGEDAADMPLGKVRELIDEVAELGVEEFLITGGEPLVREDLPAVLEHLGRRGVRYSLNTAVAPAPPLRRAFRRWPPSFVAVSVDGPAACHDRFRGRPGALADALTAVRFFSELCPVAAGTTVTTANIGALPETFQLVVGSGASSWGLHLPVAEGRARQRPDLFPSKAQLGHLLRFTARKRHYFPVLMADELGYCGDCEPLVRDRPLRCGAGRAQCVVLPDGEVVPCTTLDRRESAGNLNQRSLFDIWTHGFAALRTWEPAGKCRACAYARACQGGCWLQRRRGTPCYREVWHVPEALRSAAGIALCLGALAVPGQAAAQSARRAAQSPLDCASPQRCQPNGLREVPSAVERWGYCFLADEIDDYGARPVRAPGKLQGILDPSEQFYLALRSGGLGKTLAARAQAVTAALATRERSLSLVAVLWRTLAEPCLDGPTPAQRPPALRAELRAALAELERKATAWRREIFEKKLDPYLARESGEWRGPSCKSRPSAPDWLELARDTNRERWGTAKGAVLAGFLARHPYPSGLDLALAELGGARLLTASGQAKAGSMGIFDVLVTGAEPGQLVLKAARALRIALPANAELGYVDVLRLAYEQHTTTLDEQARAALAQDKWGPLADAPQPWLLQPMRKLVRSANPRERSRTPETARWWLADFWMF